MIQLQYQLSPNKQIFGSLNSKLSSISAYFITYYYHIQVNYSSMKRRFSQQNAQTYQKCIKLPMQSNNSNKGAIKMQTQQSLLDRKLLHNDQQYKLNGRYIQRYGRIHTCESEVRQEQSNIYPWSGRQLNVITQRSSSTIRTNKNVSQINSKNRTMKTSEIEENRAKINSLNILGDQLKRRLLTQQTPKESERSNQPQVQLQSAVNPSKLHRQHLKKYLTEFQPETIATVKTKTDCQQILSKIKVEPDGYANEKAINSQFKRLQARIKRHMIRSKSNSLKKIELKQLKALKQENKKVIYIIEQNENEGKKIVRQMQQPIINDTTDLYIPNKKFVNSIKKLRYKKQSSEKSPNKKQTVLKQQGSPFKFKRYRDMQAASPQQ